MCTPKNARIEFEDPTQAQYALRLDGNMFQGTKLTIEPWNSRTAPAYRHADKEGDSYSSDLIAKSYPEHLQDMTRWIYVGNLPDTTTARTLSGFLHRRLESTRGIEPMILTCRVVSEKGFAFVEFEDYRHAEYALKLDGNTFQHEIITVQPRRSIPDTLTGEDAVCDSSANLEEISSPTKKFFSSDISCASIFVENLPESTDSSSLSAFFQNQLQSEFAISPEIVHCCVRKRERDAFLEFQTKDEARFARNLIGRWFQKHLLAIRGWNPNNVPNI
jgi:RNA recognition motif-containing protein